MAKNDTKLESLRAEIDAIDNSILKLLAKRVKVVRQVGDFKRSAAANGQSIIRPGREAEMVRRVARQEGDLPNAAALAQIWRIIIASAINIEENPKIATVSTKANRECYWLAREYFGAFTPMSEKATTAEVIQDVVSGDATVGVVPLFGREGPASWWSRLESDGGKDMPKIFAKLPFVQIAPSTKEPLVAVGYVDPEPTGEDESLWVIRAEERVSLPAIEKLLKEADVAYTLLETCRVLGVSTTHHYLLKIDGFMDTKSRKLANVAAKANELFPRMGTPVTAHYLGSYAVPMLVGEE